MDGLAISDEEFKAAYYRELLKLEEECREYDQVECPLLHDFAPGVYNRTMFMPKGTFVIGKTHKTKHFNVVLTGVAKVMIDGEIEEIRAPHMFVSEAGVKKVLYILEDMTWMTIHPTEKTDLDELEKELVYSQEDEKELIENQIKEVGL